MKLIILEVELQFLTGKKWVPNWKG